MSWNSAGASSGAASGAAIGTSIMPGWGTAIGAGVGLVAGGLMGGGDSNELSSEQKALLQAQVDTAKRMDNVSSDQYGLYNQYSPEIYDNLFEEINQGPDYAGAQGRYSADIEQSFASMEDQAERDNFRMGVNPASGRYEDTVRRNGIDKSLAHVNFNNVAQREEDDKHWARMLTGADAVQGFMNNTVNAAHSSMGGNSTAAGGFGNMAATAAQSQANGMQAAGYLAKTGIDAYNNSSNGLPASSYTSGNTTGYSADDQYGML